MKINSFADKNNIKIINLKNITCEELVGRENSKIVSVIDENLASAIVNELEC